MPDQSSLLQDMAATITTLCDKVNECVLMGRPVDAVDYASALKATAEAYWALCPSDEE